MIFRHKTLLKIVKFYNIRNVKKQNIFTAEFHVNLKFKKVEKVKRHCMFYVNISLRFSVQKIQILMLCRKNYK